MKMAHISTFALAGLLAIAGPALAQQQETERVNRTASIRAGGQLRVKNFSGTVTITGARRGDVAIQAVRRAPRERLDRIKLEVTETGSGVTIEANRKAEGVRDRDNDNVVHTQLDIQVPDDVTLDVEVFSSDIKVVDVTRPPAAAHVLRQHRRHRRHRLGGSRNVQRRHRIDARAGGRRPRRFRQLQRDAPERRRHGHAVVGQASRQRRHRHGRQQRLPVQDVLGRCPHPLIHKAARVIRDLPDLITGKS
jgi:hypothetical protein